MNILSRDLAVEDLTFGRKSREAVIQSWVAEDIDELMGIEAREWTRRSRALQGPIAGLGFTGAVTPNIEPTVGPSAVTGGTVEVNLYTPATSSNSAWSLLPIGVLREPQTFRVIAAGTVTSSGAAQTLGFGLRIGTSATATTNAPLGQTGPIALASTITAPFFLEANITVLTIQPGGTAIGSMKVDVGQQATTGFVGSNTVVTGLTPGTITATFDATQQQGVVITLLPSAAGVSVSLKQFLLVAWD